jgi:imidazolonepropionase-like amidohydrolase
MLRTLEKGKGANLIAVTGDPLANVGILADTARIRRALEDGAVAVRR